MKKFGAMLHARRRALTIALSYAVGGCVWILCSDLLVHLLLSETSSLYGSSMLKGSLFVLVTSALIYWLLLQASSLPEEYLAGRGRHRGILKALLEHIPSPCALYTRHGTYAFVNKALCDATAIPREHFIGRRDEEVFGEPFSNRYLGALKQAFATGKTQRSTISYHGLERGDHHYLVTHVPLLDDQGEVEGVVALTFDFSAQHEVEVALSKGQQELEQIVSLVPHLIFAKDADGQYIMANEALARFHNCTIPDIIGKRTEDMFGNPEAAANMVRQDREVLESGKPIHELEESYPGPDGVMRKYRVSKIPYITRNSEKALLGVVTDVTEAFQQAEALRESESRFRNMVERSVDALFVYSWSGEIINVNERAVDYLGVPAPEMVGRNISELLSMAEYRIDESHLYLDGSQFDTMLGLNGQQRPVEVRVGTLQQQGRQMYLAEARDISDRLEQERERNLYARFGLALSRAETAEDVAQATYDVVSSMFEMDAFLAAMRNGGQSRYRSILKLDTIEGKLERYENTTFMRDEDSMLKDVYRGKPLLVNRKSNSNRAGLRRFGDTARMSASVMYVPLQVRGRVFAFVSVHSYTPDAYTDADLQQLQRVADLAAPALERCRSDFRAAVFARIGKELAAVRTAKETGVIIAREADALVGWDSCILGLYTPLEDTFTPIYTADVVDGKKQELVDSPAIAEPKGMLRRALQSSPGLMLREELPPAGNFQAIGANRPAASIIWVPIVGRQGITGALSLQSYSLYAFDESDLESVIALADHCSTALERTAAELILTEREDRYRRAIEASGGIAYQLDYETFRYMFMGEGIQDLTGVSPHDFTPQMFQEMTLELVKMPNSVTWPGTIKGRQMYTEWHAEVRIRTTTGDERWITDKSVQINDAAGRPIGTIGVLRDITEQKLAERTLRASEERYALAARGANDGLWDWNIQANNIHFSSRWKEMLGYTDAAISDSPEEWFGRVHSDDYDQMQIELQAHLDGISQHFQSEFRMAHADGSFRWMLVRGIAIRDEKGKTIRMAGSQTDITERVEAQTRAQHDALHDALTALPNRTLLMDRIGRSLERGRRKADYKFALVFMDLDRFKTINDSLGHLVGDLVLKTVAARLLAALRPGDTVARFAGDEFAMVLEDISDEDELKYVASRVQEVVSEPMQLEGHEVITTTSVGIALSSPFYDKPEDMLRDADNALYRAKASGAGRWQIFDSSMHTYAVQTLALEADLRRALDRNQIKLYYQPVVAMGSGRVERFEGLARWFHPERGMIAPDIFIPLAEEMGLIGRLSEHVMRLACRQLTDWTRLLDNSTGAKINVNLSPRLFARSSELVDMLATISDECKVNPRNIGLEITESVLITGPEEAQAALQKLKDRGFLLYLDDFGTGYSSLSYLSQYRFDMVKIDRSFVMRMTEPGPERDIVQAIMVLAGSLRMGVVAEGVETAQHLEIVRSIGCDSAQGYFFSAALPPEDATSMLLKDRTW